MPPCMPTLTSGAAKQVPSHLPPFTSSTSRTQGKGTRSSWMGFLPGGGCSAEPSVAERVLSGLLACLEQPGNPDASSTSPRGIWSLLQSLLQELVRF